MPTFDYDVIVVGGGIVGVSAALACAKLGFRVALVEKTRLAQGATGWSGGVVRRFHLDPDERERAKSGFPFLSSPLSDGSSSFYRTGFLYFPSFGERQRTRALVDRGHVDSSFRWITPHIIKERWSIEGDLGAVYEHAAGCLDPRIVCLDIGRQFIAYKGEILEGIRLESIGQSGESVTLATSAGLITSRCAVLSTGHFTPTLLDSIGVAHSLFSRTIQVCLFAADIPAEVPAFTDEYFDIYGRPGTQPGTIYVGTPTVIERDPSIGFEQFDLQHAALIRQRGLQRFPWMKDARLIGGLRHADCYSRKSSSPVHRLQGKYDRIVIAAGFSGGGIKMAPWAGSEVALYISQILRTADPLAETNTLQ